jgi:hypothetical protein
MISVDGKGNNRDFRVNGGYDSWVTEQSVHLYVGYLHLIEIWWTIYQQTWETNNKYTCSCIISRIAIIQQWNIYHIDFTWKHGTRLIQVIQALDVSCPPSTSSLALPTIYFPSPVNPWKTTRPCILVHPVCWWVTSMTWKALTECQESMDLHYGNNLQALGTACRQLQNNQLFSCWNFKLCRILLNGLSTIIVITIQYKLPHLLIAYVHSFISKQHSGFNI